MVGNNRITEFIEWILMYDPNLNTLLEERMDEEGVDFDLPESVKDLLYSMLLYRIFFEYFPMFENQLTFFIYYISLEISYIIIFI